MLLLIAYVSLALVFSFLCSIAEAVLLSVTVGYIAVQENANRPAGKLLRELKEDINKPLAAILTLNTIAHTIGAAGAGAQAAAVFGSAYLGLASAILTLLILIFSEIIPKTLGAHYWQRLAPLTAYCLQGLIWLMYPFVRLSEYLTQSMTHGPSLRGFNRDELVSMAELSWKEGQLMRREYRVVMNLLSLDDTRVQDAMTPRTVVYAIDERTTVAAYFAQQKAETFSRIPIYRDSKEQMTGFVLRNDLLLAQAQGKVELAVSVFGHELAAVIATMPLSHAFNQLLEQRANILLVVDEYGGFTGILTLEDVLETILGVEIMDEADRSRNMQELARRFWRRRHNRRGNQQA